MQVAGTLFAVAGLVGLTAAGYVFRDDLTDFISDFIDVIEEFGPAAPAVYSFVSQLLPFLVIAWNSLHLPNLDASISSGQQLHQGEWFGLVGSMGQQFSACAVVVFADAQTS